VDSRYDLRGKSFHRLTVIEYVGKYKNKQNLWRCKCTCGGEAVASSHSLICGNTKSCGCLQKEKASKHLISITATHGLSRDKSGNKTRLFRIWTGMKTRCYNQNDHAYMRYGGRGITICEEWLDFKTFHDWAMNNGYLDALTIERKELSGNYEPSNCIWDTMKTQANNRRNSHYITYMGITKTMKQWADELGMPYQNLFSRIKLGWSTDEALSIPMIKGNNKPRNHYSKKVEVQA